MSTAKFRLINYFDVWGNKKDGYEVNNLCTEREDIDASLIDTDHDILTYLKEIGFFKRHVRLNMITIEDFGLGDLIEISERKTGKPILRFEQQR